MSDPVRVLRDVLDDLRDEGEQLDRLVAPLEPEQWSRATPAPRWTVAHQIAHLAWTDDIAVRAATGPEDFAAHVAEAASAPGTFVDEGAEAGVAAHAPGELLARWRDGRARVLDVLRDTAPGTRIPWYGPPMSPASLATARLMETWAHGQDVADALGAVREPTGRLRHVARIGVRARDYAFAARGMAPPPEPFRVELVAPDGHTVWAFGPEDADQRVSGAALDFCLLVTRRAHRADLGLRATGPDADRWLGIAQAFAGPAGAGRPPKGAAR
ncbi:TIGR03084 family metal-binding protein [Streptomyces sp. MUM 203J]|uniref:TIGR03084 family metal-binding protein n=1 Tax=Streptomyces sp. MUM 203J TaxID=2791990 RepID=UPI001F0368EC|nr:TIGR03084 family metal-binding protein [Streptomyces sp. MUM 203J]